MGIWNFQSWLRDSSGSARKNQKRRKTLNLPLRIEALEERLVPANFTFVWTGQGADTNWSTAANWLNGVAPISSDPTDQIQFGLNATADRRTAFNDLSGRVFNAITISASGYTLAGESITLGTSGVNSSGNIVVNAGAINNTIANDLRLVGGGSVACS